MKNLKQLFRTGEKKYNTGLILSGGGAKGFAHAGILKALNEKGIYPDVISGVSAGAIAGALYADGYTPDQMLEIFKKEKSFFDFAKVTIPKMGLSRISGLRENLSKNLRAKTFENLKIPLYIAATNLKEGKIVYFNRGEILDKILASAAIPVVFEPVEIDGDCYVDGGVMDHFPVLPIAKDCKRLIGVSLNPIKNKNEYTNMFRIADRSFHLAASLEIQRKKDQCDILIEPEELADYGMLDVSKIQELFELGYRVASEKLKSI